MEKILIERMNGQRKKWKQEKFPNSQVAQLVLPHFENKVSSFLSGAGGLALGQRSGAQTDTLGEQERARRRCGRLAWGE